MFTRGDVINRYVDLIRDAEFLKREVDEVLLAYSRRTGYLYQSRLKERDSFLQKLETGRFESTDVNDLLACTLVVFTAPQVRQCIDSLPAIIQVVQERGPGGREKEPEVFRFDEWQLICQLDPPAGVVSSIRRSNTFELQVKTVTLFAWAQATHDLVYKGDEFDWRRERLSAQLRAAAEQADILYTEFVELAAKVPPSRSRATDELALLARSLKSWLAAGLVPNSHAPPSPVRFAQSVARVAGALRVDASTLCGAITAWLEAEGFPVSLSLYQVVLGVAVTNGTINWSRVPTDFRCLVTSELIDAFPATSSIPLRRRIVLPH